MFCECNSLIYHIGVKETLLFRKGWENACIPQSGKADLKSEEPKQYLQRLDSINVLPRTN